jgi:hypothetical protein
MERNAALRRHCPPLNIGDLVSSISNAERTTNEHLIKAFTAAVQVADGYWTKSNADFGNTKYVFHPCHHSFSSAVVFLQALQRCKLEIAEAYMLEQVEEYMTIFLRFFSTIAERWPAASRCLEEYERLLAPVKKEYVDFLVQRSANASQATVIDNIDDFFENQVTFDEVVNFWNRFGSASGDLDHAWSINSLLPHDWNAKFDFAMDVLSGA